MSQARIGIVFTVIFFIELLTRAAAQPPEASLPSFAELAKMVAPAVVHIYTIDHESENGASWSEKRLAEEAPDITGQGTGFLIDSYGAIVTNNHVIRGGKIIKVRLLDRREFTAAQIGADPVTDLALLKIEAADLPCLEFGDSDALEVGEWVLAVGNPFGLSHTVTAGIVSAKGRSLAAGPYADFIQTDASINPGNSGGPLLNTRGQVVGINTLIKPSAQGISFAIPSRLAQNVIRQLRVSGKVRRASLGVETRNLTPESAAQHGLALPAGALIIGLDEDGAAQRAGGAPGDVIVACNDKPINESADLRAMEASAMVGDRVALVVMREGKRRALTAILLGKDDNTARLDATAREALRRDGGNVAPLSEKALTMNVVDSAEGGVLVVGVDPDGPAARAGMQRGDFIVAVSDCPTENVAALRECLSMRKANQTLTLEIRRQDRLLRLILTPRTPVRPIPVDNPNPDRRSSNPDSAPRRRTTAAR